MIIMDAVPAVTDPTKIPVPLLAWYSADFGTYQDVGLSTPATAQGATVKGWADRSGNGFNLTTSSTGSTLQLNQANRLPAVSTGSNLKSTVIPFYGGPVTAFFVFDTAPGGSFLFTTAGSSPYYEFARLLSDTVRVGYQTVSTEYFLKIALNGGNGIPAQYFILMAMIDPRGALLTGAIQAGPSYAAQPSNANSSYYVSGNLTAQAGGGGSTPAPAIFEGSTSTIASGTDGAYQAEAILYQGILQPVAQNQVVKYLQLKYDLPYLSL